MRDSIIVDMEYADLDIIDGSPNAERHHVIFGRGLREISDAEGLWIPLSHDHHEGNMSVHHNNEMRVLTQIIGQIAWEKQYILSQLKNDELAKALSEDARNEFLRKFGRKYL